MRHEWVESARRSLAWGIVASLHAGMLLLLIRPGTWQSGARDEGRDRPIHVRFFTAPIPAPARPAPAPSRQRRTAVSREVPARHARPASRATPATSGPARPPDRAIPVYRAPLTGELEAPIASSRIPGSDKPIVAGFHFDPIPPSFAKHLAQVIGGMASCGNIAVARNMTAYQRAVRGISDRDLDRVSNALGCR